MTVDHPRKVRSFVRRPGRITTGQQRALAELMPRWGIPFGDTRIDLDEVYGRFAPRVLDVGFGDGEALVTAAARHTGIDYLGVEVHDPGIGHLLALIQRAALTNVRIIAADAVEVIERMLPDRNFDAVNLFFPDPWPKKRHHKRRIIQPGFVNEVARILKPSGLFHIATDWANYAGQIVDVIGASPRFGAASERSVVEEALAFRAPTKFERRGRRLGHEVVDFYYRRLA
ncbi:MAG TPA: tRNA (guanosine(46)-N7)-methyltransferase TrmB [Gammaproteobacteria bacterium]|nr:tRNA (guanosine(46)-N7)-methyltransferase TrmB [Gammaproteobacteria bacterium]